MRLAPILRHFPLLCAVFLDGITMRQSVFSVVLAIYMFSWAWGNALIRILMCDCSEMGHS